MEFQKKTFKKKIRNQKKKKKLKKKKEETKIKEKLVRSESLKWCYKEPQQDGISKNNNSKSKSKIK